MAEAATGSVPMPDLRTLPTETLLRRVAVARRRGDVLAARAEWEACCMRAVARVRTVVAVYRTVHGDRVALADRDSVVWEAIERACRRMIHTLDQLDERSFGAAMATCAENACKDHFRRLGAAQRHQAGSLDADDFAFSPDLARAAEAQAEEDERAFAARVRVEAALPQLKNVNRRRAVELRERGLEYEEIAKVLGVSRDNAYQLYSRGLRDLRKLMEA